MHMMENHYFRLKWGLGDGTNNKVELLSIYMFLTFAHEKGLRQFQTFGDSMIIINWLNTTQIFHNILLSPILEEVSHLKATSEFITFHHVYRE